MADKYPHPVFCEEDGREIDALASSTFTAAAGSIIGRKQIFNKGGAALAASRFQVMARTLLYTDGVRTGERWDKSDGFPLEARIAGGEFATIDALRMPPLAPNERHEVEFRISPKATTNTHDVRLDLVYGE